MNPDEFSFRRPITRPGTDDKKKVIPGGGMGSHTRNGILLNERLNKVTTHTHTQERETDGATRV